MKIYFKQVEPLLKMELK